MQNHRQYKCTLEQAVHYNKTNWWKVNKWQTVQRCQEKQKKVKKKKTDSFAVTENLEQNVTQ